VFNTRLLEFATSTSEGFGHVNGKYLGFDEDGKLIMQKISAISIGEYDSPYEDKHPIYEQWEDLMVAYNDDAPDGL
jgi:hypothetical protein